MVFIITNELHLRYPQLKVNLFQDIYEVHRAFKPQHITDYKPDEYVKDVKNNIYLEQLCIYNRFQFNPCYIINDDLFDVISHIYGLSLYVTKIINSIKRNEHQIRIVIFKRCAEY